MRWWAGLISSQDKSGHAASCVSAPVCLLGFSRHIGTHREACAVACATRTVAAGHTFAGRLSTSAPSIECACTAIASGPLVRGSPRSPLGELSNRSHGAVPSRSRLCGSRTVDVNVLGIVFLSLGLIPTLALSFRSIRLIPSNTDHLRAKSQVPCR